MPDALSPFSNAAIHSHQSGTVAFKKDQGTPLPPDHEGPSDEIKANDARQKKTAGGSNALALRALWQAKSVGTLADFAHKADQASDLFSLAGKGAETVAKIGVASGLLAPEGAATAIVGEALKVGAVAATVAATVARTIDHVKKGGDLGGAVQIAIEGAEKAGAALA